MSTVAPAAPRVSVPGAERLIARVRAGWRRLIVGRALAAAVALLAGSALLLLLLDLLVPLPAAAREGLRFLPPLLALVPLGIAAFRLARVRDPRRFALLAEERAPDLGNRLRTALELGAAGDGPIGRAFLREAGERLRTAPAPSLLSRRARAALWGLAGGVAALALLAAVFPELGRQAWERWAHPADAYVGAWREVRAEVLPVAVPPPPPGFDEIRWRIQAPAYAGLPEVEGRGDGPIAALPGSRVTVHSRFPERWSGVEATRIGGEALPTRHDGDEWRFSWTLASGDRGVSVAARMDDRVIARRVVPIRVLIDQPPEVVLHEPAEDMVLGAPRGRIPLRVTARDDLGVDDFGLSWIRSRGGGETFEFQEGTLAWDRVRREGGVVRGEATLDLERIGAAPGDVLHVHSVARDRNRVTGPGESVSETRVIRIARPDEMHTVTTPIGLPTELERNPVLSQRMLILMTERLRDRAPQIGREATVREGGEIGHEQGRLRGRVGEQIFARSTGGIQDPGAHIGFEDEGGADAHEEEGEGEPDYAQLLEEASEATGTGSAEELGHRHDEAPVIAVNQKLLDVYNAMWAAERALNQGEPREALPHQHEALRLLQEIQQGERRFVRGEVRTEPVDVATARGDGEIEDAAPAGRAAGESAPSGSTSLAVLDEVAVTLRDGPAREASLRLAALAAETLREPGADPRAAALLSGAGRAMADGERERARSLVAQARSLLAPGGASGVALPVPVATDMRSAEYFRRLGRVQ